MLGPENVNCNNLPKPGSEDFSYYINIESGGVPGAFLFFGNNKDDDSYSS